jgi:hypothetical protein
MGRFLNTLQAHQNKHDEKIAQTEAAAKEAQRKRQQADVAFRLFVNSQVNPLLAELVHDLTASGRDSKIDIAPHNIPAVSIVLNVKPGMSISKHAANNSTFTVQLNDDNTASCVSYPDQRQTNLSGYTTPIGGEPFQLHIVETALHDFVADALSRDDAN